MLFQNLSISNEGMEPIPLPDPGQAFMTPSTSKSETEVTLRDYL